MKNKNRPYKYNSKSRLTNSSSFPFKVNNIKNDPKKSLENTLTKFRIIEDVPPETESLDNSFLEGRNEKKEKRRKKRQKEIFKKNVEKQKSTEIVDKKIEEEKKEKEEPKIIKVEDFIDEEEIKRDKKISDTFTSRITFFRKMFLRISMICAVLLLLLVSSDYLRSALKKTTDRISNGSMNSSNVIDDNYLFVGGYHTSMFSFDTYGLDYHYVNVSGHDLTTSELLHDMKGMVYDYNPSIIFLEMGLADMNDRVSLDDFVNNYSRIIQYIKSNRPNAVIYMESVYPIRNKRTDNFLARDITNHDIQTINNSIKTLAEENDIVYLDIYSLLSKSDELNSKYTKDGVSLNEEGYREILKKVNNVIG